MCRSISLILSTLILIAGCNPSPVSDATEFGRFEGEIIASWAENGREMVLREPFVYVDRSNRQWTAPAGSVVNGASIPAAFWSVIGGPFEGKYRNASVVHDVGCEQMQQPWEDVHKMFYEACRCGGVDDAQAKIMYYAVYHFGPRWEPIVETVVQPRDNGLGEVVMEQVTVQHMARLDPPPPTQIEVEQAAAFVAEENPQPADIRQTSRDQLHRRLTGPGREPSEQPPENFDGSSEFAHRWQDQQRSERMHRRSTRGSALPPNIEEAVIARVQDHVERQAGELRPAVYTVQPSQGAYRVDIQFVREDEQGQIVADAGSTSAALVSNDGQLIEFVNSP